jgi:glutamyl-tRNA synthetase
VFDPQKLEWMNAQHLMRMPIDELARLAAAAIEVAASPAAADLLGAAARLVRQAARAAPGALAHRRRLARAGGGLPARRGRVTSRTRSRSTGARTSRRRRTFLTTAARERSPVSTAWDAAAWSRRSAGPAERLGVGAGKLFQPLRVALTGSAASPGMFDVLELLGRDRSLARVDAAVALLTGG